MEGVLKNPTTASITEVRPRNSVQWPTIDTSPRRTTTTIPPIGSYHSHTFIFLHGHEDFGQYMASDFMNCKNASGKNLAELFPTMRFVFPTAKLLTSAYLKQQFSKRSYAKPVEGEDMISQWFDLWDVKTPHVKQELMVNGMKESAEQILSIILKEGEEVGVGNIILGGFGQGCATALFTLLGMGLELGGFIGMSGWLPFEDRFRELLRTTTDKIEIMHEIKLIFVCPEASQYPSDVEDELEQIYKSDDPGSSFTYEVPRFTTPMLLSHAQLDDVVPHCQGQSLKNIMVEAGLDVIKWISYPDGGHYIHQKGAVDDIEKFLKQILGPGMLPRDGINESSF